VTALEDMLQALHAQLKQTSQNSSRPPSSAPPSHPRPRRPRSKRRRGGQPGHLGSTRTLLPVEEVDKVVHIKPEACPSCQARLSGDAPAPWRHQVMELPPIEPIVTEYHWHQLFCSACGEGTRAPWPAGGPSGPYGPRVQATVALCTGAYRWSKRATQQLMHDVLALPLSVGTISPLEHATTAA
jgi:transposase